MVPFHFSAIWTTSWSNQCRNEIDNAELLTKELDHNSFTDEKVGAPFRRSIKWMEYLTVEIAIYTDTITQFRYKRGLRHHVFLGETSDVKMAAYLYFFLTNTIQRLCAKRKITNLRSKNSYLIAAVSAIGENFHILNKVDKQEINANNKAMILMNKKLKLRDEIFGQPNYGTTAPRDNMDLLAAQMGYEDGKNVSIRSGIETQQTAGLLA